MRRWLLIAICTLLMVFSAVPTRQTARTLAEREDVRAFVTGYVDRGAQATTALIEYVRTKGNRVTVNDEVVAADTSDHYGLDHGQTFGEPAEVDAILAAYASPAEGSGAALLERARARGIDAAYPLAMFIMESSAATNPAYAFRGHHNPGNIMCRGHVPCAYTDWGEGWRAMVDLLAAYRDGDGFKRHATIREALYTWAPPVENDTHAYADFVERTVGDWRSAKRNTQPVRVTSGSKYAVTEPVNISGGFYATGDVWCFQSARCQHLGTDYVGADGQAVYAPFDGTFVTTGAYAEGGPTAGEYFIYLLDDGCEVYLGHLRQVTQREAGERVVAGETVGVIRGDLAHTHVQLRCSGVLQDFEAYWQAQ